MNMNNNINKPSREYAWVQQILQVDHWPDCCTDSHSGNIFSTSQSVVPVTDTVDCLTPKHRELQNLLNPPLADLVDVRDVGEEVMVLCGGHGFPQRLTVLEVTHQDAQTVQVWVLWGNDLKNGLSQ